MINPHQPESRTSVKSLTEAVNSFRFEKLFVTTTASKRIFHNHGQIISQSESTCKLSVTLQGVIHLREWRLFASYLQKGIIDSKKIAKRHLLCYNTSYQGTHRSQGWRSTISVYINPTKEVPNS